MTYSACVVVEFSEFDLELRIFKPNEKKEMVNRDRPLKLWIFHLPFKKQNTVTDKKVDGDKGNLPSWK